MLFLGVTATIVGAVAYARNPEVSDAIILTVGIIVTLYTGFKLLVSPRAND